MIYLDTHIVVWLYDKQLSRLSEKAVTAIENNELFISPIVKLELQYLYEIKRVLATPQQIIEELENKLELKITQTSFSDIIESAISIQWTRDCFDRLIVAEALLLQKQLITKDEKIRANFHLALW